MTFIASVVAKKGVAVIADSLVTSMSQVIEYNDFIDFIKDKAKKTPVDGIKIDPMEIVKLFNRKPSHTKDFEEKLFKYEKYTAIMTAGTASINNKRIEYLIKEAIEINKKDTNYNRKRIKTKIGLFIKYLKTQILEHLKKYDDITPTTFIFTHYEHTKEISHIYKIDILACNKSDIKDGDIDCVIQKRMDDYYKVVCDGQNRISERILFGEVDFFLHITPKIVDKVISDLKIKEDDLPEKYREKFMTEARTFLPKQFFDDMKVNKLAGLSLQQAVDLASLLMKIEINFQKYTENIPTVGGVIKLAVIDEEGFRFISGNDIIKPININ